MTFADWQWSRGILPWTFVHEWSEARYVQVVTVRRVSVSLRRVGDEIRGPLTSAALAAAAAARALAAVLEADA